jgi:DNA-binding beta-propeller fold protein YncE
MTHPTLTHQVARIHRVQLAQDVREGRGWSRWRAKRTALLGALAVVLAGPSAADAMVFHTAFGTPSAGIGSPTNPDGQFSQPQGISADPMGTVYVADSNNKRIQKFDRQGNFLGKWTVLTTSNFNGNPVDVAADASRVWVIEQSGGTLRRYSPQGVLATTETINITVGSSAGGVGLDLTGNLLHSSYGLSHLRRYTRALDTWTLATTWGTAGTGTGQLARPMGVAASPDGTTVYVAERDGNRVQRFSNTGTPQGTIGTGVGTGDGQLSGPLGVAVDPRNGDIWVADTTNKRVQRFGADGSFKEKIVATGGPGPQPFTPTDIAVDGEGYLYVLDTLNTRVIVFKDAPAPPPNTAPTANQDTLITAEDTPGTLNVLANDSDIDGDGVTVTASTNGSRGSVACAISGACTYTPSKDFNGADSFTYTATDSRGATATGTVKVTVTPVDDPIPAPALPKPIVTAKPTPLVVGPPQTVRVGNATISAPKTLSVAALRTAKCVNVKVTSKNPVQVLVTIYSGKRSLRLFGKKLARLTKPGTTVVCVPVPKRAHTFRPRDGLTLDIRSAGLSRVGLQVAGVSSKRVSIGLVS